LLHCHKVEMMKYKNLGWFLACALVFSTLATFATSFPQGPDQSALPDFDDAYVSPRNPFGHDWMTMMGGDIITAFGYISDPSVASMELETLFCNRYLCPAPPPPEPMIPLGGGWFSCQFPGDYWLGTPTYDASNNAGIYVSYRIVARNGGGTIIAEYPGPIGSWNYVKIYPAWPPTQLNATSAVSTPTPLPGSIFWVNGTAFFGNNCTSLPPDLDPGMTTKLPVELSNVTVTLNGTEYYGMTDINGNYSIPVTAPVIPGSYMVNTTVSNTTPNRNVNCVSDDVEINVPGSVSHDIMLQNGWNLISIPLPQTDTSILNVLSTIAGKWDYAQYYDSSTGTWVSFNPSRPAGLNDLTSIDHTMGFWINTTEVCILDISGPYPTVDNIALKTGWNLVGYPTLNSTTTVAQAFSGTGADRIEICDILEPYRVKQVAPTYVMKPGEGYWVHVPADTTWIVDW